MSVIDSYLDTLFAPYPETPRMHDARSDLHAMMEDKRQGLVDDGHTEAQAVGIVIAEFGSLEEVAEELGITSELGTRPDSSLSSARPRYPSLSRERAQSYTQSFRAARPLTAVMVPMFVLSPVPMLLMLAAAGSEEPPGWVAVAGIVSVLVIVVAGVLVGMLRQARMKDFLDIEEGRFTPSAAVHSLREQMRRDHQPRSLRTTGIAIVLWVLSAVPVLVTGLLFEDSDTMPLLGVCGTLLMVAVGLATYIAGTGVEAAVSALDPDPVDADPEHSESTVVRVVAALYWPMTTAIYLGWSFLTNDWGITWVIWPIAGVLWGALWAISTAVSSTAGRRSAT